MPHLASGPIDVGPATGRIQFEAPVSATGGDWELCFEFDKPGDSHRASSIGVTLLTVDGATCPLIVTGLDRRGEATVCLIGRSDDLAPGTMVGAVDLVAPKPLRLRHLGGGNRESP